MNFSDAVEISGAHKREDGYLVVDARIARTGIQRYLGSEVGKPELAFVDVYRPESEVFKQDAMSSFAHRPVTDDHPTKSVTSDNWKDFAIGQTDGNIKRDGDFVRVPLMIADGDAIRKIEGGKRELSAGYTCDLVFSDGMTPEGVHYDAIQTNIRANHVAVVDCGRAGLKCRIGDDSVQWGLAPIPTKDVQENGMAGENRTVLVDGLSVVTTDHGAQAIEKLMSDRATAQSELATKTNDFNTAIKAKDAEIAKKDAEIDDLKSKALDQDAIDKLVADRASLEVVAKKIASDVDPKGMSDADLRKAVVVKKLGDAAVADKSDAYIDARFDILAEDASKHVDPLRETLKGGLGDSVGNSEAARQKAFDGLIHFDQFGKEKES